MKLCAYCGCECGLGACFCPRCGTTSPTAEECVEDAAAAAAEEERTGRRHLAGLLLLARQNGFAVFLAASLLSKLRYLGDPIVLIFIGLVPAVLIALIWPAVFAGAMVAVLIEGVALGVAWLRLRPFLDKVTKWDLVGGAAAADDKEHTEHTRVIAAFRLLRICWSRLATWPVAVSSAALFLLVIMAHHQYESWSRARPFRSLSDEDVAAYQRKVRILVK